MKISRIGAYAAFVLALPLFAGGFFAAPAAARADDPAANCMITTDDLAAVTAAEAQGLTAELAARRALLSRVLGCAKEDAGTLQASLNAVPASGAAAGIQSQLSGKLDDAMNYYDIELGKLSGAGIAGTQAIARETLSWRQGNYDPLAAQTSNFILWAGNQTLFATANGRLGQMEGIVSFVDQAAPNTVLEGDIAAAETLIQAAQGENNSAEQALSQSLPPDQALALIQRSLQSLSDAYQKFSDISTIMQKLLPGTAAKGS